MGGEGFEPSKRAAWQIYSLHPLATWITPLYWFMPSEHPGAFYSARSYVCQPKSLSLKGPFYGRLSGSSHEELAEGLEPTTC